MRPLTETRVAAAAAGAAAESMTEGRERGERMSGTDAGVVVGLVDAARLPGLAAAAAATADGAENRGLVLLETTEAELVLLPRLQAQPRMSRKKERKKTRERERAFGGEEVGKTHFTTFFFVSFRKISS